MADDVYALQMRVAQLERQLEEQEAKHSEEVARLQGEIQSLHQLAERVEQADVTLTRSSAESWVRRVEWRLRNLMQQMSRLQRGQAIWSPEFRVGQLQGLRLEFYPHGRENTSVAGFCSLFLWAPAGCRLKYQLFVGSFLRAPDDDSYEEYRGQGHTNFCPIAPELDVDNDTLLVGVDILEISELYEPDPPELRLVARPIEAMVTKAMDFLANKNVQKVIWKIPKISKKMTQLPRGAGMYSPVFTAAGILDIMFEFYPNGSSSTTKDGYCAFYLRCAAGSALVITLFVGKARKGPIEVVFDGMGGRGLPDFCLLREQISEQDDSLQVGIELKSNKSSTLILES
eukprot:TRINITY_DN20274_c0_g1_i2.p1 TRINITY_DN20274_c0_g1~~TRINITY_DN20274_c0_g1_i2.p1  ORF type:complete len:343 (-),score=95.99 TRINITY_DN20274_c0_g1_i2:99-1127(-)